VLERLLRAGVDVVRLNFSHGKAQDHIDRANWCARSPQRVGKPVALMADLQGPKIRVGKFADGKVLLEAGQPFVLDAARTSARRRDRRGPGLQGTAARRAPGRHAAAQRRPDRADVDAVRGEQVHTVVKVGGELSNNKGINKQGGGLTAPALTGQGHGGHQAPRWPSRPSTWR
jgi:pyruvate kinase